MGALRQVCQLIRSSIMINVRSVVVGLVVVDVSD